MCAQYRLFLGGCTYVICSNYRENGGPTGSKLGGRCITRRDPVLPRGYAIRSDVRSDRSRIDLHDPSIWSRMQGRHWMGHYTDNTPRTMWHVFRYVFALISRIYISKKYNIIFSRNLDI